MTQPTITPELIGHHCRHAHTFAVQNGINAIASMLPILSDAARILPASAVVFGSMFFAAVAAPPAFARRSLPQA